MSGFQRMVSEKVYQWQRKKLRKQNKSSINGPMTKSMPQIIGFKVEGNQVKNPTTYQKASTRPRRRGKKDGQIDLKKVVGIALIAIGCILILTKCFMGKEDAKESEKEVTQVEQTMVSFETSIQDLDIDEETIYELLKYAKKHQVSYAHTLGVWALESYKGTPTKKIYQKIRAKNGDLGLDNFGLYNDAENVYKQFIYDIEYFPIKNKKDYTYENGWKEERNYNGKRKHYGIDLMARENKSGVVEVLSMTSGVVENIGWNETGGYRVGIRSQSGAYFYYAHLHEQLSSLEKGDLVQAGDCIGYMGDTGYGEEGTRGKFPVHLHVGIGVQTQNDKEYWINPYYILRYLEKYGR